MGNRERMSWRRELCAPFGMNAHPPYCGLWGEARGARMARIHDTMD